MTQGERILYEALWHCRDANGMGKFKTFSLGYDRIAFTASVDEKTVRVSVPKLISKRILDLVAVENSATRTGRTYRIYSYESILERQRAAGLTHIIKNGKAVEFVWQTGSVAPTVGVPPTVGGTTTVGVTPTVEAVRTLGSTSATTLRALALTIRDHLGSPIDDALLQEMVTACHTNAIATAGAPAPDEALLEFVAQKAPEVANFARRGRVETTPARVLVAAVTRCFEGEAYRGYVESRAAKQQEALTSAARQVEQQAALQAEMAELEARAAKWTTVCDRHKTAEGRYDLKAIAEDLKMDEKGREAALAQMQRLGRFSQVGL
jgi:hypothetical protein